MEGRMIRQVFREGRTPYLILAGYFVAIILLSYGLWYLHIPLPVD